MTELKKSISYLVSQKCFLENVLKVEHKIPLHSQICDPQMKET